MPFADSAKHEPDENNASAPESTHVMPRLSDRYQSPMSSLAWFSLGVIIAICLIFAIIWFSSFFQGPIVGYNELGGPVFAKDQFFVNLGAGLAVLAAGWITALSLRTLKVPRALMWGILVVTTPLGIAFACGM